MNTIKSPRRTEKLLISTALGFGLLCGSLFADVKLPAIFGDHMVLQQDAKLPIWGTADPDEKITVTVVDKSGETTAGPDGKWRIELAPLPTGSTPVTMTVIGKNTLKFEDVLIGDVWICSGQSNMAYGLGEAHNSATELPKANDPQLRLFQVGYTPRFTPQSDLTGKWQLCTPVSAEHFSAAGYFFGKELRTTLGRPIGLIGNAVAGSPAQAWITLAGLKKEPAFANYLARFNRELAGFPAAEAAFPSKQAAYKAEMAAWGKETGVTYGPQMNAWKKEVAAAKAAGKPAPPQPVPAKPRPSPPLDPNGSRGTPTALYNGILAPLIPYAIKGVIWYQGESNARIPSEYRMLFTQVINDWRANWGQGDFPFLFVQLAACGANETDDSWPYLREAQFQTLSLPRTGIVTAIDIGSPKNLHPQDKMDVGLRLAQAAKHIAYGQDVVYSGPVYASMKVEGAAVRVSFTQTGGGLIIGTTPWRPKYLAPLPTDKLVGFAVAGADQKWTEAEAMLDGDSVVVSSPQVAKPVAVRYAWHNSPECNLYNKEMLPALPFRTDNWARPKPEKAAHGKAGPSPAEEPTASEPQ